MTDATPNLGQPVAPDESRTSGKAIASLILGLASFLFCLFTGIPAIVLGALSHSDISKSGGRLGGRGMATTGLVLGGLGVAFTFMAPILVALLLPAVQAAREAARRNSSTNNLKQICLSMHNYHDQHGAFPASANCDADGQPLLSWRVHILPYIEEAALYEEFHLDKPWDSDHNYKLIDKMPSVFQSPASDAGPGSASYVMPTSPGSIGNGEQGVKLSEITDGSSNTILVVEVDDAAAPIWTKPDEVVDAETLGAILYRWPGRAALAGFADGHVSTLDESLDAAVFEAMLTIAGGEQVIVPGN